MAVLMDDVGAAIVTLLNTTPFVPDFIVGANYAYAYSNLLPNRALVRPLGTVTEQQFKSSGRIAFNYDIYFEVLNRTAPEQVVSGIQEGLRKKLQDNAETLYATVAQTNDDLKGGSLEVEILEPIIVAAGEDRLENELIPPDSPMAHVPVIVRVWQSYS